MPAPRLSTGANCPYRKVCAASGRRHSPNRTAKLKQLAALLPSGERNSRIRGCARKGAQFGQGFQSAKDKQRTAWQIRALSGSPSFGKPAKRLSRGYWSFFRACGVTTAPKSADHCFEDGKPLETQCA